jgi:hypothetical protein
MISRCLIISLAILLLCLTGIEAFPSIVVPVVSLRSSAPTTKSPIDRSDENDRLSTSSSEPSYLDYLEYGTTEDMAVSRNLDEPFHILLLGATFDNPKMTLKYVTTSCEYVLGMPDASEPVQFCQEQGMACLGTWSRHECLRLGRQLLMRDLVCRVVPFVEGGQRSWQAKQQEDSNSDFEYSRSSGGAER